MNSQKGFSLVELIVVMSIITILSSIAMMSWNRLTTKSNIESQIKTLHADLMSIRLEALYGKRPRSVVVNGKNFMVYSSSVTTVPALLTKSFKFNFILNGTGNTVTFDTSGMTNGTERTICIDQYNDTTKVNDAYVDSLVISQARINLGKRGGGDCDSSNVTQK